MFCPHCGQKLPQDAKFCGACGKQIQTANNGVSNATPLRRDQNRFAGAASVPNLQRPQPPKRSQSKGTLVSSVPYALGGALMVSAGICWVAACVSFCSDGVSLVASTLDATSTAWTFPIFMVACLVPALLAFLSTVQVIRGFLERDFSKTGGRALRWAWPCLVISIALMGACIAFSDLGGSAWLHVLSSFCDFGLGASIAGTVISSLGILLISAASASSKQYAPASG